ncbi:MAG: DUF309 domain-containing protein [Nitrospira sp.]|nr:MAG: DUF309 domain-containing protein [Nitrospira sp.]
MQDATVTEPESPDSAPTRYSSRPFPSYRFVPGRTPHPRRNPRGHSYGQPESTPGLFPAAQWKRSDDYLYGIDLYNFAFWWESHEVFEGLWHASGRSSVQGNFFQSLIQLAAANLKHFMGNEAAAQRLIHAGIIRLQNVPSAYMGIDVRHLLHALQAHRVGQYPHIPLIEFDQGPGNI